MEKDKSQTGYVYILTNKGNSVLYVGSTANLSKRIYQHKGKYINGFIKRYNLNKLVYFEIYDSKEKAVGREKIIKGWLRKKKKDLIESKNPEWKELDPSFENTHSG